MELAALRTWYSQYCAECTTVVVYILMKFIPPSSPLRLPHLKCLLLLLFISLCACAVANAILNQEGDSKNVCSFTQS